MMNTVDLLKASLSFLLASFLLQNAQAQFVDGQGYTDYSLRNVIIAGSEIPAVKPILKSITARLELYRPKSLESTTKLTRENCSATVIASDVLVTAAHCLHSFQLTENIHVFVKRKEFQVRAFIRHPKYVALKNQVLPVNDIALIFLASHIPNTHTAVLPPTSARLSEGSEIIVAGFGYTQKDGELDRILRYSVLQAEETRNDGILIRGKKIICSGDSGGPGFVQKGARYILVGVSSTSDCVAEASLMRVSDYIPWIKSEVERHHSLLDI